MNRAGEELIKAGYVSSIKKTRIAYSDIGTHCIVLYTLKNNATYFDSFGG